MAAATTQERKSPSELRADKKAREEREAAKAAKPNGRAEIDAEHVRQGTPPDTVPGVSGAVQSDPGPQDIHGSDEDGQTAIPTVGRTVPMSNFVIGGKKPTTQSLRLLGGKIDLPLSDTSIEKGDSLVLTVEVRVKGVNHVDEEDAKTGQVIGCERRVNARITGMEVA